MPVVALHRHIYILHAARASSESQFSKLHRERAIWGRGKQKSSKSRMHACGQFEFQNSVHRSGHWNHDSIHRSIRRWRTYTFVDKQTRTRSAKGMRSSARPCRRIISIARAKTSRGSGGASWLKESPEDQRLFRETKKRRRKEAERTRHQPASLVKKLGAKKTSPGVWEGGGEARTDTECSPIRAHSKKNAKAFSAPALFRLELNGGVSVHIHVRACRASLLWPALPD